MVVATINTDDLKYFSVAIYGNLEPYNETISKARVRIFYKGFNRNGTYITDEYAEKLISSLAYAPIKGILDDEGQDFTDHGIKRTQGRAYGVVPDPVNFAWEKHLDEDGIEREYACADVLLWTGIYEEAKSIVGKSQSMELYEPSIEGAWKIVEGRRVFVYTSGCFLGLQVLGNNTEPCFEGSAFYSLYTSLNDMVEQIKQFNLANAPKELKTEEKPQMQELNFKLSDRQKHDCLWSLLNINYCEESGWAIDYAICDIYDNYAVVYNYSNGNYERVYYSKDDATDSLSITNKERCYILDVTEAEKNLLENVKAANGGTFEAVDTKVQEYTTLTEASAQKDAQIEELNASLETEKNNYSALQQTNESLTSEIEGLKSYKKQKENEEKEAIFAKYQDQLDDEVIERVRGVADTFTIADLEKELSFELVKANPSIFSIQKETPIPKPDDTELSGIEKLLEKHKG